VFRVYDSTGKFAFRFGRPGEGPGEFRAAMSGVFGPDGLFWVILGVATDTSSDVSWVVRMTMK
jgi:hypothetical protein